MALPTEQQLVDDIAHADGGAKSLKSLYALYRLKGQQRVALRRLVKRLAQQGRLVRLRGEDRWGIPRSPETVAGVLSGTSKGFAFLAPDDPALPDVFVRAEDLHGAFHGDRVEVAYRTGTDPDRPAGEVIGIVSRGTTRIVGLFVEGDAEGAEPSRLLPFDRRITTDIVIPKRFRGDAEDGLFVEAALLREARAGRLSDEPLPARVVAVLGAPDEPGTDVRVILRSFGLADAHSEAAQLEAERAAVRASDPAEIARRRDLRDLATVTIDGESARDFDDAISVAKREGGGWRLWVHIADVSAHVAEGTALDDEAHARATSVYFPDRAVHMLPEALAANACSLRPGEDRLAMTAVLDHAPDGSVAGVEFFESIIRSDRRMTYTQIKRILVDRDEALRAEHAEHLADFELMGDLAGKLIARREARGGLDFDLPVPIVHVDAEGLVTEIVESERNVAHRIIEEFMIAANEAVARFLVEADEPAVHRNHEPPPPDKLANFREVAASFGYRMPEGEEPAPAHVQSVLRAAQGKREEYLLTTLALRTMSLARYEVEPKGHFGLALDHYTHFTSPIRRYPDLIVHRALKRRLSGEPLPPEDAADLRAELSEAAAHCSQRERNAESAERALVEWKKAAFMADRVGERCEARVTGIAERGIFVLLRDHHVEGFVPFQGLRRDWYDRDERGVKVIGRDTGRVLRVGDALTVRVQEVDVLRRRITMTEA